MFADWLSGDGIGQVNEVALPLRWVRLVGHTGMGGYSGLTPAEEKLISVCNH